MPWVIIFSALIAGMASGALILHLFSGKRRAALAAELENLRLKNVENQTALESSIQRHTAEKKLIHHNHEQQLALLKEHYNRTFAEMEKTHQARHAQLKEEFKVLSDRILEDKSG